MTTALSAVADLLRCPVCGSGLEAAPAALRCGSGHAFDVARQGHVSLTRGRRRIAGDTAGMVEARDRILRGGHYDPLTAAVVDTARGAVPADAAVPAVVVDLGGGTGHHSARLLDAAPSWRGICLDVSTPALRRAARAHPRLAAVGTDIDLPLPLQDGSVDVVLSVFGPRDADGIARVLRPDGILVVASPDRAHLHELVAAAGLVRVDTAKRDRLADRFGGWDRLAGRDVRWPMSLDREPARDLAQMGPSGHHLTREVLAERLEALPEPVTVTGAVSVAAYQRPRPHPSPGPGPHPSPHPHPGPRTPPI